MLYELGLALNRDSAGQFLTSIPPNPLPKVPYAVTQELNGSRDALLYGGAQLRAIQVLVSVYGFPLTAAGRQQCVIVLAWLRHRAREVDRHPGIRVSECIAEDDSGVRADVATTQHYASLRLVLTYTQATTQPA